SLVGRNARIATACGEPQKDKNTDSPKAGSVHSHSKCYLRLRSGLVCSSPTRLMNHAESGLGQLGFVLDLSLRTSTRTKSGRCMSVNTDTTGCKLNGEHNYALGSDWYSLGPRMRTKDDSSSFVATEAERHRRRARSSPPALAVRTTRPGACA